MADEDHMLRAMEQRMSSPLVVPGGWDRAFRTRTPAAWWFDQPVRWQMTDGRKPRPLERIPTRTDIYQLLRTAFGHIAANPSKSGARKALEHNYVPADEDPEIVAHHEAFNPEILLPNKDLVSAKDFLLKRLGPEARSAADRYRAGILGQTGPYRDLSSERVQSKDHKWFLLGDRGVGKTIFMNYILTVHSPALNRQRVIWSRIDLTKEAPPGLSVAQWVRWKILKTLFQYHDLHSYHDAQKKYKHSTHEYRTWKNKANQKMIFDLVHTNADLFRWAHRLNNAMPEDRFKAHFEKLETRFRSDAYDQPESIDDIDETWFFDCIWNYIVVDQKCSFLLLFDGMDQLGLSGNDRERFERLRNDVQSFLTNEYYLPSACLITMREHSYREMSRNRTFRSGAKIAVALPVSAKRIYERRVEFLKRKKAYEERYPITSRFTGETAASFCSAYLRFCTWCLTNTLLENGKGYRPPTDDITEGFAILESIYGNNRRKLFEALVKAVAFFLARLPEDFERWLGYAVEGDNYRALPNRVTLQASDPYAQMRRAYYLFVEALMLGDISESFRKERYLYRTEQSGGMNALVPLHFADTDSSLLFNVFHYPIEPSPTIRLGNLMAVRLLQFARASSDGFRVEELVRWAAEFLRYPESVVGQLVSEMLEGGILKYKSNVYQFTSDVITIGRQGEFLLDRLVPSLEYASIGQQTSAVPIELLEADIFPIRPYRSMEFVSHNKLISVINFTRMLREVENVEEMHFNMKAKGSDLSFSNFHGRDLRISGLIAAGVKESITHIVRRLFVERRAERLRQLDSLLREDKRWNLPVEAA